MKKKIILSVIVFVFISTGLRACDICGCGVGNSYIGILPDFYKHIFGIRYRHNSLLTHVGVGGANTYLTTSEKYNIVELWGGWTIAGKFRLMLNIPYSFNDKVNQGAALSKNGFSDISVSGYYQVLNKRKTVLTNKLLVQSLWIGAGIKLPSGKYNPADKSVSNQNTNLFQLGTASIDYTLAAMYDLRLQDAGVNLSGSFKMNSTNRYGYAYGNKLNLSSQAYYKIRINNITLGPNAGIQYETGQKDVDNHFSVDLSGGTLLLGTFGIESSYKKVAIGANWQTPFSQHLAGGFVKANSRMMMHVSFAL